MKEDEKSKDKSSDNLFNIIVHCDLFQKVNFLMILCVFLGQILKLIYDAYANTWLEMIIKSDTYEDIDSIWMFN